MDGRKLLICLWCAAVVAVCLSFLLLGYGRTWRLWGVPVMSPHFGDARVILSGAESFSQGHDPLVSNPMDPWLRPMNYPRIWLFLGRCGLDQNYTTIVGLVLISSFFFGVFLLSEGIDRGTAWIVATCLFSPAVIFGIERANNDLAVFCLVSLAAYLYGRFPIPALICLGVGGVLKLFPFMGFAMLFRENRHRRFFRLAIPCAAFSIAYATWTRDDIRLIGAATPQSTRLSYGAKVVWMAVREHYNAPLASGAVAAFSFGVVALAMVLALVLLGRDHRSHEVVNEGHLNAFRAGCAIYLGSFLLTSNWDYRLMFLLLTIPALSGWARIRDRLAGRIAVIALPAILFACWSLGFRAYLFKLGAPMSVWFVADQGSKWVVFVALLSAFASTLPDWVYRGRTPAGWLSRLTRR